ncbi:hypothetical protein KIH86_05180 [Paenibacillus sp. HN-1]|nr:hypothetical protein [Paenibacillus sp. CGMCC 1.18879]MBY9081756.1 hypothetical protein [Paenibacillus sp. CGMCC 1.18879]MBY9083625.1 hypothetical protein [Paenibacillus sinensis]
MPTFDSLRVTGSAQVDQDLHVEGNETVQNHFQVNGNATVSGDMNVNGSGSVSGSLHVYGSQTVAVNLGAGTNMSAGFRIVSLGQAAVPSVSPSAQSVKFYNETASSQPGIILKGTDGVNYVLFIDVTAGIPTLGIQKA